MERLTNGNYGEISHTGRIIPYSKHCVGCIDENCDCGIVEDIDKMAAVNSNTQLYKQFGNSIVVDVMCAMFKNLNIKQGDSSEALQTN
nr:MAG TPA: DNA cytosine methylase [Caudoviricetes sp.]